MPANATTTSTLADSLPIVRQSARQVREFEGVMTQVVDRVSLEENVGLKWSEVDFAKLTASDISEDTCLDNPQRISDTLLELEPTVIGIQTLITDRVQMRISANAAAQIGSLAQNAIERKKNQKGHTILDGATTSLGGGGAAALNVGEVAAGVNRIQGNANEPGMAPYHVVLHPFQLHDIWSELTYIAAAGAGNAIMGGAIGCTAGSSIGTEFQARVLQEGFLAIPTIAGARVFSCGLISTTGCAAKGGVFAQEAILLVQGREPRVFPERKNSLGGGADVLYVYDEFIYGERSSGNWLYELHSDATAPAG